MIQQKLTGAEKHSLEMVRYHLANVKWKDILGGYEFWVSVQDKIGAMLRTNTNDGKPYVDPKKWRVPTDEDAKRRPKCRVRDSVETGWQEALLLVVINRNDFKFYAKREVHYSHWRYCEILDEPTTY